MCTINKGEEVRFDYATTETVLTQDLAQTPCLCGSSNCRLFVKSYSDLSTLEKEQLKNAGLLANHIF
ncbi:MAG: hypothetical protein IPO21_21040 [Bacteroidales bacterium]|nr:hypothetical protein [Bacteroidales bacterium]